MQKVALIGKWSVWTLAAVSDSQSVMLFPSLLREYVVDLVIVASFPFRTVPCGWVAPSGELLWRCLKVRVVDI